jgi:hypothetical protein
MAVPQMNRRIDHAAAPNRSQARLATLRPARNRGASAAHMAGPFQAAAPQPKSDLRATFVTGLLVVYPAFATVLAILFGLFLTGRGA